MELLAGLVFVAGALAALWAASASYRSRRAAAGPAVPVETLLARALEANELTPLEPGDAEASDQGLVAEKGPLRIELRSIVHPEPGASLTISGLGHSAAEFALRRKDADRFDVAVEDTRVETVDPELAHRVLTYGDETVVRAILNANTRERLLPPFLEDSVRRLTLFDGELHAELRAADLDRLPEVLSRLLDLARDLARPESVPERLAENARADPLPEVRTSNLVLLHREYPDQPVAAGALRDASRDPDTGVQLQAAALLGEDGRDVLLGVAMSTDAPPAVVIRAVSLLGEHLPTKETALLLEETLQAMELGPSEGIEEGTPGLRDLALTLVDALSLVGGEDVIEPLARVLSHEDADLAILAAIALGRTGEPAAEEPLLQALGRDLPTFRATVAAALGKVGSAKAVGPLKDTRGIYDVSYLSAAHEAIARIQSRLTGATPGQLALADDDTGQLSLAEGPPAGGQVSMADEGFDRRVAIAEETEADTETDGDTQRPAHSDRAGGDASESARDGDEPTCGLPLPPDRRETE